jgi:hypothetical protein
LSHRASFHSCERITPSNRGIKHLSSQHSWNDPSRRHGSEPDGECRGECAGMYDLPRPAPHQIARHKPHRATERRNQTPHRCGRRSGSLRINGSQPSLPDEASIRCLVGAIGMEQTEEWTARRGRDLTLETLAPICDELIVSLPVAQGT